MNLKTISYVTNDESLLDRFTDQCLRPVGFLYRTMFGNDKMKVYRIVGNEVREDVPSREHSSVVNKVCLFVLGFIAIIPGTVIGGIAKGFSVCTSRHKHDLLLLQQFQATQRTLSSPSSPHLSTSPLSHISISTSIPHTEFTSPLTNPLLSIPSHLTGPTTQSEAHTASVKDATALLSLEEEARNLQNKITALNEKKDELQKESALAQQKRSDLYTTLHSYANSIKQLQSKIKEIDNSIKSLSMGPSLTSRAELDKQRQGHLAALDQAQKQLAQKTTTIRPEIEQLDTLIQNNHDSILRIAGETHSLTSQRLDLLDKIDAIKKK